MARLVIWDAIVLIMTSQEWHQGSISQKVYELVTEILWQFSSL